MAECGWLPQKTDFFKRAKWPPAACRRPTFYNFTGGSVTHVISICALYSASSALTCCCDAPKGAV